MININCNYRVLLFRLVVHGMKLCSFTVCVLWMLALLPTELSGKKPPKASKVYNMFGMWAVSILNDATCSVQ